MTATKGLSPLIQELRVVKSEAEIKIMRQAGEISGKAFIEVNGHSRVKWQGLGGWLLQVIDSERNVIRLYLDDEVH